MSDAEYRQTPAQVAETVAAVNHPSVCGLIDFSHAYIECTRLGLDWRPQIRAMAPVTDICIYTTVLVAPTRWTSFIILLKQRHSVSAICTCRSDGVIFRGKKFSMN